MTNLLQILLAISLVESGDNDKAIGKYGERSRYQITRETWEEHSSIAFSEATDEHAAILVAKKILEKRKARFLYTKHREPSVRELYILWHRGLGARFDKLPKKVLQRAERFENTYREITKLSLKF